MASKAMMGGNMKGRMAGNGSASGRGGYKVGLSGSGKGRTRIVSQPRPYKARLAKAGEG